MRIDLEGQRKAFEKYVGFSDGHVNHNPFGPWQGVGDGQAWCDSSAQWGACVGGGFDGWDTRCQFGKKGSAYCPFTIGDAKRVGLWRQKGSGYQPRPGDQELYDWEGNGVADHIAGRFIARRPDGTHVTWEGNHNDQAGYVVRDDRYVVGWVALSEVAGSAPTTPTAPAAPQEEDVAAYITTDGEGTFITNGIVKRWVPGAEQDDLVNIGIVAKQVFGIPPDAFDAIPTMPGGGAPSGRTKGQ